MRSPGSKDVNRMAVWRLSVVGALLILFIPTDITAQPPKVADPNTHFNRLYILGNGDNASEDEALEDDLIELKGDLERTKNQKSGSDSTTFVKPTKKQVQDHLDGEKRTKQPGEELTFFFSGHGNVDRIRVAADERFSAQELAAALTGFRKSVTVVVILDSCFGGSLADEIGESDHVAVIGPSTECPFDPPGIFGGFTETLPEAVADKAGEGEADENEDGIVTADELKRALEKQGWKLGQPQPGDKVKKGKSKCLDCDLPSIAVQPPAAARGTTVRIAGDRFGLDTSVTIDVLGTDLRRKRRTTARTDAKGSFQARISIPSVPAMIVATDREGNEDWHVVSRICDVDVDGDIDKLDLRAISRRLEHDVGAGSAYDVDGDGRVTAGDKRVCTARCSASGCARVDPLFRRSPAEPR